MIEQDYTANVRGLPRVGGCSNSRQWEIAKDRELDALTDDQLVYLDAAIAVTLGERGWVREPDGTWRLDV